MSRGDTWVALTPWSFFVPTLLAAALGVFIANAASRLVFGDGREARGGEAGQVESAPKAGEAGASKTTDAPSPADTTARASAAPERPRPAASPATTGAAAEAQAQEPLRLPGPSVARRDGGERACINGTVARRASNGWEQEVVGDAPARCVATSN